MTIQLYRHAIAVGVAEQQQSLTAVPAYLSSSFPTLQMAELLPSTFQQPRPTDDLRQ
jgi:hypothetical protein